MTMLIKLVPLIFACFLLGSKHQPVSWSQAARLLDENAPPPAADDAHGKSEIQGSKPRTAGFWTGDNSPTGGTVLTPPPATITKFAYKSSNATANGPNSSSSASSTVMVRTVTPAGRPSPSVTVAVPPSIATPGHAQASSSVTIRSPGVGSPPGATPTNPWAPLIPQPGPV